MNITLKNLNLMKKTCYYIVFLILGIGMGGCSNSQSTQSKVPIETHIIKYDNITTYTVAGVSFNMIRVEGGSFAMGGTFEQNEPDDDELPIHKVTLPDYYIGETEVTQELWAAVMGKNYSNFIGKNLPVENVSWSDCQEFIYKLSSLTTVKFRLPTEAEWEYAARGGHRGILHQYSGNDSISDVAWYFENSDQHTHEVKTKKPNDINIYDMSGNVWEWCLDWYGPYSSDDAIKPQGPETGETHVLRGGSWLAAKWYCRVSLRSGTPNKGFNDVGFRLAQ